MTKNIANQQIIAKFVILILILSSCVPQKSKTSMYDLNEKNSLVFSGYEWNIKSSTRRMGPGNNYFSSSTENVWLDNSGHLNLKISKQNEKWNCAEVISKQHFGYGYYEYFISARLDKLDKNSVLGLFTYDKKRKPHFNEIDIEFSKWNKTEGTDAQYVVHHNEDFFKSFQFFNKKNLKKSTHVLLRTADSIYFASYEGHYRNALYTQKPYQSWTYKNDLIPMPANEKVHINLWLYKSNPLTEKKEEIITIEGFRFTPIKY